MCAAVAALLGKLGHEAVLASNTIDGIAIADGGAIDVALIDMNIPGLDGLEAVKAIARIVTQKESEPSDDSATDTNTNSVIEERD